MKKLADSNNAKQNPSMLDSHSHAPLTVLFQLVYNDLRQTTTKNDFKYQHSKFNLVLFFSTEHEDSVSSDSSGINLTLRPCDFERVVNL